MTVNACRQIEIIDEKLAAPVPKFSKWEGFQQNVEPVQCMMKMSFSFEFPVRDDFNIQCLKTGVLF